MLNNLFEKDLSIAIKHYEKIFSKNKFPTNIAEAMIEMLFQLGLKNFIKFKKMISAFEDLDIKKATEEMIKSKWDNQTPKRVKKIIKIIKKQ